MKIYIYFNWSFLVAIFLVGHALADGSSDSNEEFKQNLDCIAASGNQGLCDLFLRYNNELPEKILGLYYECIADLMSNDIGECTDGEELYHSAETRRELNECIIGQVDYDSLSDREKQQVTFVDQCTEDLAEEAGCAADEDSS